MDDQGMIKLILKGKVNHYESLVKKYQNRIFGYFINECRSRYVAEELTQITFIKAFEKLNTYDFNKPFSLWLIVIAKNTKIDYFRKKQSEERINEKVINISKLQVEDSPEDLYTRKEFVEEAIKNIDQLEDAYRDVIILRYFDDLSYKEISQALNIPIGTVKSRMLRAKGLLKKRLTEKEDYHEMFSL